MKLPPESSADASAPSGSTSSEWRLHEICFSSTSVAKGTECLFYARLKCSHFWTFFCRYYFLLYFLCVPINPNWNWRNSYDPHFGHIQLWSKELLYLYTFNGSEYAEIFPPLHHLVTWASVSRSRTSAVLLLGGWRHSKVFLMIGDSQKESDNVFNE